uniref:Uncharacterized protein n=1 Tax=Fagus sylvatica TaxID=28930 RepID=A0A2N9GWW9_FAGSY
MVGETNGPNEHEVRMATSKHKFDDLLAFVYMMVKQVVETGNQKRKDDKNTNGEVSEGRPHINMDPLPRPPTLPKPKERDPQLDSKIDDSEEKIRLMRGLSSFGTQIPSRMEKKSSKIFREYTQWWREMATSGMPPSRRERDDQDLRRYPEEPILQSNSGFASCSSLWNLILVEERVEDAVKTKRMVDMPALMALVEQIAKRTLVEKNEEGV